MISVVVPAFNEAQILAASVGSIVDGLRDRELEFEVIVVENGSTDATLHLANELAAKTPEVRVEHRPVADYGRALRTGLLEAHGDAVVNFDADFFDLEFLDRALGRVLALDGPAIVVGSKRAEGADDARNRFRKLATAVFAMILRVGFGLGVSDTHGMKALNRSAVKPLARECRSGQDLFDTELILRVERAGMHVEEIPVSVRELRPARSSFVKRVPRTLVGLCKLRWALWRENAGR